MIKSCKQDHFPFLFLLFGKAMQSGQQRCENDSAKKADQIAEYYNVEPGGLFSNGMLNKTILE